MKTNNLAVVKTFNSGDDISLLIQKGDCTYVPTLSELNKFAESYNTHDDNLERIKKLEAALFKAGRWLTADSHFNLSELDCEISELLQNKESVN